MCEDSGTMLRSDSGAAIMRWRNLRSKESLTEPMRRVRTTNFFDMEPGTRTLKILRRSGSADRSDAFERQIQVRSVFDIK